jgi:hypothetical protein
MSVNLEIQVGLWTPKSVPYTAELRATLRERAAQVPAARVARLRRLDYHPRKRPSSGRRWRRARWPAPAV